MKSKKEMKKTRSNKGLSPVIATVLLIAITISMALVIFLWFKGISQEAITKDGRNIELVCNDVVLDGSYDSTSEEISIINNGNIPVYQIKIKIFKNGGYETEDADSLGLSSWPSYGLNPGATFSGDVGSSFSGAVKVIIIPVLLGKADSGDKTFTCSDNSGKEITL